MNVDAEITYFSRAPINFILSSGISGSWRKIRYIGIKIRKENRNIVSSMKCTYVNSCQVLTLTLAMSHTQICILVTYKPRKPCTHICVGDNQIHLKKGLACQSKRLPT